MGKKGLLVLVALVVIGVGVYLLVQKSIPGTAGSSSTVSGVISGVSQGTAPAEIPADSLVRKLRDSSLVVAVLSPGELSPVVSHFTSLKERAMQTAAWKKLKLDEMLQSQIEAASAMAEGPSPSAMMELVQKQWSTLKEIGLVVSAQLDPTTKIPGIMLAARFADDKSPKSIQDYIEKEVLKGQDSGSEGDVTISRVAGSPSSYAVSNPNESGPFQSAQLAFEGSHVLFTSNGTSPSSFLVDDKGKSGDDKLLVDSAAWKGARNGFVPGSAGFAFVDFELLLAVLRASGEIPKEAFQQFANPFQAMEAMTLALHFQKGLGFRQCVRVRSGSSISKTYEGLISGRKSVSAAEGNRFLKIMSKDTLVGFRISGEYLRTVLSGIKGQFGGGGAPAQQGQGSGDQSPAPEMMIFNQVFESLDGFLKELDPIEFGVLVNGPRPEQVMGMMQGGAGQPEPDVGFYMSSRKKIDLAAVAAALNKLVETVVGPTGLIELPIATVADAAAGSPQMLKITVEGESISFASVDENSIAGSQKEAFVTALINQAKEGKGFVDQKSLEQHGMLAGVPNSDAFMYLSTTPILEIVRPLAPMALMFVPQAQLTLPEVEEVLKLAEVQTFSVQSPLQKVDDMYCTDSLSVTL